MICHDIDANPTENISNIFLDIFRKRTYLNLYLGSWILSRDKFSSTFVFIVITNDDRSTCGDQTRRNGIPIKIRSRECEVCRK